MKQRDPHALMAKQRKAGPHKVKKQPVPVVLDDPFDSFDIIRLNHLRMYLMAKRWAGKPLTKEEMKCLDILSSADNYKHFSETDMKLVHDVSYFLKDPKLLKKKMKDLFD